MIIFYNKATGKIYGSIFGRVHSKYELDGKNLIQPHGVKPSDVVKKVFNIEETKAFERKSDRFRIMEKMVIVGKDGEYLGLKNKVAVSPKKPDSVETIVIDLKQSLRKIKSSFGKDTIKYIEEGKNLSFREISFSEKDLVLNVLENVEEEKDISLSKRLLRNRYPFLDGLLKAYVVENNNEVVSACVVMINQNRFIYKLGGVTHTGRKIRAGDKLIWELIKEAKTEGYDEFDFGGIYSDKASQKKQKVNLFKMRWGGEKRATWPN